MYLHTQRTASPFVMSRTRQQGPGRSRRLLWRHTRQRVLVFFFFAFPLRFSRKVRRIRNLFSTCLVHRIAIQLYSSLQVNMTRCAKLLPTQDLQIVTPGSVGKISGVRDSHMGTVRRPTSAHLTEFTWIETSRVRWR